MVTNLSVVIILQIYVYQIIILHTLHLPNVICWLYFQNAGKKIAMINMFKKLDDTMEKSQ